MFKKLQPDMQRTLKIMQAEVHNYKPDPAKNDPQPGKVNYDAEPKKVNE